MRTRPHPGADLEHWQLLRDGVASDTEPAEEKRDQRLDMIRTSRPFPMTRRSVVYITLAIAPFLAMIGLSFFRVATGA